MFRRVHRLQSFALFLRERVPHYGPLVRDDLHKFRDEIARTAVGAGISAAAGFFFAFFVSIAVQVTAWDSAYRTAVAWIICGSWGIVALVGLRYARKAVSGPPPFGLMAAALSRDYAALLAMADREEA